MLLFFHQVPRNETVLEVIKNFGRVGSFEEGAPGHLSTTITGHYQEIETVLEIIKRCDMAGSLRKGHQVT